MNPNSNCRNYLNHISIDCVIFGFHHNSLQVLLLKWKSINRWALPGGFIKKNEHADAAAQRVLKERTRLSNIYLSQFHTFSDPDRNKTNDATDISLLPVRLSKETIDWIRGRFVTIGYYALVDFNNAKPVPDMFSEECRWWELEQLPILLYDHNHIVDTALLALRDALQYQPMGKYVMPKKFTLPELQKLYETILGHKIDRRNYRKKILSLNIIHPLGETRKGGAHKSPELYSFN